MVGVGPPARCGWALLLENVDAERAFSRGIQPEDLNVFRKHANGQLFQLWVVGARLLVLQAVEFVVEGEPDAGFLRRLMQMKHVIENRHAVADDAALSVAADAHQRIDNPVIDARAARKLGMSLRLDQRDGNRMDMTAGSLVFLSERTADSMPPMVCRHAP